MIQDRVIDDISIITPGMANGDDTLLEFRGMLLRYLMHVRRYGIGGVTRLIWCVPQ